MLMRDKDMSHIHPIKSGGLNPMEYRISVSAVNNEQLSVVFYNKTGIAALCNKSVACSQHC